MKPVSGQVMQYLNAKLTAAGPYALPYADETKMAVRDQLLHVVEVSQVLRQSAFPSLLSHPDPPFKI